GTRTGSDWRRTAWRDWLRGWSTCWRLLVGWGDDSTRPAPVNCADGCLLAGTFLGYRPALRAWHARTAGRVARGGHRPGRRRFVGGRGAGAQRRGRAD